MASQPTELHIQNVQSRAGFGKLASPANQRLDRFSLLVGQTKRDAILACAEPVILLPGRPFTLTHIHEICTKFNEGYTLHRMASYGYASGNRSVRSTLGRFWVLIREALLPGCPPTIGGTGHLELPKSNARYHQELINWLRAEG